MLAAVSETLPLPFLSPAPNPGIKTCLRRLQRSEDIHVPICLRLHRWIARYPNFADSAHATPLKLYLSRLSLPALQKWVKDILVAEVEENGTDPLIFCAKLFTLERLQELSLHIHGRSLEAPALMAHLAATLPAPDPGPYGKPLSYLRAFLHHLADLSTLSLGLSSLGRPITSQWEAGQQLGVYHLLFSLPFTFFGAIVALGASVSLSCAITLLTGAALILGLKISFRKWRPCPEEIHQGINLVRQVSQSRFAPAVARQDKVQEVIDCLAAGNRPLLVGPSGVGKTEIMKGVAYRIAQGSVPPSLKGKKVYLINTASLLDDPLFNHLSRLQMITERLKGFEQEVLLFFDELQSCFEEPKVAHQLKTALDEEILQCAAALSNSRLSSLGKEERELLRRFREIVVPEATDDQAEAILQDYAQRADPRVLLSKETMKSLLAACPPSEEGASRLSKALHLLHQAIHAAKADPSAPIHTEQGPLHGKALFACPPSPSIPSTTPHPDRKRLDRLLHTRRLWEEALARLVHDQKRRSHAHEKDLKTFFLLGCLLPSLQDRIEELLASGAGITLSPAHFENPPLFS